MADSTSHQLPHLAPSPIVELPPIAVPSVQASALAQLSQSKAHKLQLKMWQKEEKALRWRLLRKEINRSGTQNEIYQLLALYFVFQGVVFAAVAQSSILSCEDWWSPFSLSLIASLSTVAAIAHKIRMSSKFEREFLNEKRRADALFNRIDEMRMAGSEYDLDDVNKEPRVFIRGYELGHPNFIYWCAVTVTLLLFSSFILVSCYKILCSRCSCKS